jgi:hypothetical protein
MAKSLTDPSGGNQGTGARKIKIVNIGLEPWEAIEMGLEIETLPRGDDRKAVAKYVLERDDEEDWQEWLQTHRVELNAMTTPQLIRWLDQKMTKFGSGKLIPPPQVLEQEFSKQIEQKVREEVRVRILREANFDAQVADAIAAIKTPYGAKLARDIARLFKRQPDAEWRNHIETVARKRRE